MSKRPTLALIDRDNLRHNFARLRECAPEGTAVMAIVKANGYGHGDIEVARALEAEGADSFGVAMAEEGIRLREGRIKRPIVLLAGLFSGQAPLAFEHDLTPVVFNLDSIRELSAMASERGVVKNIHVKIDTGMGRLGILPEEVEVFFTAVKELPSIEVEGLCSHFADMEKEDKGFSSTQLAAFKEVVQRVHSLGFDPPLIHMSNSASIVDFPGSHLSMIRPGLMLYGAYPAERLRPLVDLRPVLELKSAITQVKKLPPGTSVSYGRTFVTERESLIATVPAGYADGIPKRLSGKGEAIVRGKKVAMAGVVCMDMTMLDVTDVEGARAGDEVTFIGKDGEVFISVEEIAEKVGTIPYEILCNVGPRVPREYI